MCVNYSTNPITIDCGHCLKALCLPELAGYLSSCSLLWMQGKDVAERLYNKYPYQELVFLSWKGSLGQTLSSEHYRWGLPKETEQIFCEDDRGLLCVHCWLRSRRLTEAAQQTRLLGTPGKGCLWRPTSVKRVWSSCGSVSLGTGLLYSGVPFRISVLGFVSSKPAIFDKYMIPLFSVAMIYLSLRRPSLY